MKKQLAEYFEKLGITVHMHTKARGHQGFFLENRIDISKNIPESRIIPTLLHEFAHFIHKKVEPDMQKTGGSIENIFKTTDAELFKNELLAVTHFVDKHSLNENLHIHRELLKKDIKKLENEIKKDYPKFLRSKKFREFDRYIKRSKAKYLLKYDRVKYISPFLRHVEYFSIENLDKDFPDMPKAFSCYIKLKSLMRKQARISSKLNRVNKYYERPTELFARFVEGLYQDMDKIKEIAPHVYKRFFELLKEGYYFELKNVFEMLQKI